MKSWIYFVRHGVDGPIKIGRALDPHKRVRDLGVGSPIELVLLGALLSEDSENDEIKIHARLREHCLRGEWFVAEAALHEMQRLGMRITSPEKLVRQETTADDLLDANMNVRVSPEEIVLWKRAAQHAGLTLSQWTRSRLNIAAACEEVCERSVANTAGCLMIEAGNVQEDALVSSPVPGAFVTRAAELEAALAEALDIAEWEASESRGKRSHPERLRQLRQVLAAGVPLP